MNTDDLAQHLVQLRETRGWSREELSARISAQFGESVEVETICHLEEGEVSSFRTIAVVMAALYDMSVEEVISRIVTS